MQVKILDHVWSFVVVPGKGTFVVRRFKDGSEEKIVKGDYGLMESPRLKHKRMLIRSTRSPKKAMERVVHEYLHGADWDKDEEWVEEAGHDLIRLLFRLFRIELIEPFAPEVPETLSG